MSRMTNRILLALPVLLLASTASPAASQTAAHAPPPFPLQLRWELVGDTSSGDATGSMVQFTLTNRDTKQLPKSGWAIYFSAMFSALLDSSAAFQIQDVMADL